MMEDSKAVVVYGSKPEQQVVSHPGLVLLVLVLGAFVSILNQTLLNVAIPRMMNDFSVSADMIQWLSTGYMLINGILIPISAFLIGTFTTRQLFISAMISFTIGSFICSIAPGFTLMLVGRLIQGLGAGIIMPLMMTVILNIFPPETRGRSMGMIGIAMFFAPAVGPTLSGWILEHWTWRLLFYVAMPLAIVDIVLAFILLKNVTKRTSPKFDVWGFIFSTVGFGSLLYGCSEAGGKGWGNSTVLTALIIGGLFIVLFIIRELTTDHPMLDLKVFKYDIFTMCTIVSCIVNMAMFGATILVPIYVQNIRDYTPLQSGLLMLPGALLMGIMSPVSGILLDKIGIRPLAVVGLTITAITTWEFTRLDANTTFNSLMLLYTFRMFGMSFIAMTIMTAGLNQLPSDRGSHGTAAANTARQVAASIGTAVLVTIMSNRSSMHMGQFRDSLTSSNPYLLETLQKLAGGLGMKLGSLEAGSKAAAQMLYGLAIKQSTIEGINDAFVVATILTIVALALSFFLRRSKTGHRNSSRALKTTTVVIHSGTKSQNARTHANSARAYSRLP